MFSKLSDDLKSKFNRKDELSHQLLIVKIFDLYKDAVKKQFPEGQDIEPLSLKKKVLTVRTQSASLANELRLHEQETVEHINRKLGTRAVERVVYKF